MQDPTQKAKQVNLKSSSEKSDWRVTFLQIVKNVVEIAPGDSEAEMR